MPTSISGYSLSPQQRYLWSLADPDSYRSEIFMAIRGAIDVERLQSAATELVGTNEILRTTFRSLPGMKYPVQVIADPPAVNIDTCVINSSDFEIMRTTARQRLSDTCTRSEETCRFLLCRTAEDKKYLVVSVPALCADADTLGYLACELVRLYAGESRSAPAEVQYADVAAWLNSSTVSTTTLPEEAQTDLLVPFTNSASLPFLPALTARRRLTLTGSQLSERAKRLQTSPEILVFVCWGITLRRFLGIPEFPIAVYDSGRDDAALKGALGPIAKYLPVHLRCDGCLTLRQLLQSLTVQNSKDSNPGLKLEPRDLAATWLPMAFECHSLEPTLEAGDVKFLIEDLSSHSDRFKLKLSCLQLDSHLLIELHHDRNAFYLQDLRFLLSRFEDVLNHAMSDQTEDAIAIQLVSEYRENFRSPVRSVPRISDAVTLIPAYISRHAEEAPERLAISDATQTLSYLELHNQSDRVAASLISLGVARDGCIGIYSSRSIATVVAILGVMKAGATFVALDPTYPDEWLRQIAEACQIELILCEESGAVPLPGRVVTTKTLVERVAEGSPNEQRNFAEQQAYIVFTSGSAGRPKGVIIEHRSLATYVSALQSTLELVSGDHYLHTASFSFSSSMRQLFWPLSQGASVFLANQKQRQEPLAFLEAVNNLGISVIDIIPTFWTALNDTLSRMPKSNRETLLDNNLRLLLSASEPLMPDIVSTWRSYVSKPHRIVNMFGLTETSGIAAIHDFGTTGLANNAIPIGKPLPGITVQVLDQCMKPCGVGEVGEIYITGPTVARGYLSDVHQTAQKFLPDEFSGNFGARMFGTGDRGVSRPDGTLEYRGRSNYELKIRGHRIEPEQIERIIRKHPAVHDALVTGQDQSTELASLVAYLVPRDTQRPTTTELRHFLQDKLPAYMIPNLFVLRSSLPRTLSGKTDRAAVAKWRATVETSADADTPNTEVEASLVKIWQDVLQIRNISPNDDFFDLGGQSLLGVKLLARIRENLGVELDWTNLTESPTIVGLSKRINLLSKLSRGPTLSADLEEGSL